MPEVERYEILVIGSGEAGKHVTWTFAQAGHRTAVVERNSRTVTLDLPKPGSPPQHGMPPMPSAPQRGLPPGVTDDTL